MSWLPDWITGYDSENAKRAEDADARLRELNAQYALDYGPTWQAQVARNYETQVPFDQATQRADIQTAFGQGIDEGRKNVTGFISDAFGFVGKTLSSVVFGIPFWVWALGAVAVFGWLGGFPWLLKKSKGVLK